MAEKIINRETGKTYSVKVKASTKGATTGRIIVDAKNHHRSIPVVLFTPEEAEAIVDMIEGSYATTSTL